ncbi:hypothetical protein [Actinoplanes sp. NPDC051411]|jgi:hypothetical protein|uniref:hypothetical protein n=1 Tax=Actinoplanes sp. NPDC051411 TaxID=3155522 RepID=UPI00343D3248
MSEYEHTGLIRRDGGRILRAILDRIRNAWTRLMVALAGWAIEHVRRIEVGRAGCESG